MKPDKTMRRPKKEMMLAVNAVIDGDQKTADRVVSEHKLDRKELLARVALRGGEKYSFERAARSTGNAGPLESEGVLGIDGRTKTVTLLRLARRIEELLAARDSKDVAKVRAALGTYEQRRKELREMESLLGL